MKNIPILKWKVAAGLCLALLLFSVPAPASLVMTGAYQQSVSDFTPTWTVAPSLIAGLSPSAQSGNFTGEGNTPGVSALTDGVIGPVSGANYNIYAAGGSSAGTTVTYALPVQANGYNLTNITVYSGWGNGGRVGQAYTVLYSTVANPGNFIWLTNVSYSAGFTGNTPNGPIAIQVQLSDSAGGVIAANVAAIQFDFTCPTANDENGGSGYSEITVQGTPAASVVSPVISITASNENGSNPFTPTWTAETPDLIAGLTPTTANGSFVNENCINGASVLTDGIIGTSGNESGFASCGSGGGTTLIYTLTNSPNGSDVTNIVVYSGWGDSGRDGQYYTVSYSTVSAQSTYIPITTVFYLPEGVSGAMANRVAVATSTGVALAKNVYNVKFDFASTPGAGSFNNAWQGYSEIIVQGSNSAPPTVGQSPILVQDTTPSYAETVTGDNVVFTAVYTNTPPAVLQWQKIVNSPAATNNINLGVLIVTNNGVVTSTLTLNNVQVSDSGSYTLEAVNSADGTAAPTYSTAATLAVSNAPAAADNVNVIVKYAGQTYSGITNYFPWLVDTGNDLILGAQQSGPITFTASAGDFSGGGTCSGDPTVLSDGIVGPFPSTPSTLFIAGGVVDYGTGYSMTYSLDTSSAANGFDLTDIAVFGGWPNADHNEQSYQILYATVSAPTSFVPLASVDYNPTDANATPSVTRTELVPATSAALVHNVVAVEISWVSPRPKNGWDAYSEVVVQGIPSTGVWPAATQDVNPQTAMDVVGSQIVVSASFSGATTLQWQLNGTNVPGATTSTLTLNNLQLTNTGFYTLVASNSVGGVASRSCVVTVNPVPPATNNAVTSIAEQTASPNLPFTPTWDASSLASSLILNVYPSSYGFGSFTTPGGNNENANGPQVLTDGQIGTIDFGITGANSTETCIGSGNAGNYVIYPLAGSANGYTITNITTYGGWANSGRDWQTYTIYYATAASPSDFIYLNSVSNSPANQAGAIWTRATITPATGVLASNVVALMFDMRSPAGENGYEGYSEISVFGSPSVNPASGPVVISAADENTDAPDWAVEANSLIENQLPSSVGPGAFAGGLAGGSATEGLPALTDGTFGPSASVSGLGNTNFATCGGVASGAGTSITYTCTNGSWNITNIVVYSGWSDYNRGGQFYNITYSTLSAPTTFVPLASVNYYPLVLLSPNTPAGPSANRVAISPAHAGTLATNVYAVTFDFTPQQSYLDNGFSGYAEIVLQGTNLTSAIPTPPTIAAPRYVGGKLIVTGTGGTPGAGYTWLETTNLSAPIIWTTNSTGTLDGLGGFSNSIPVSVTQPDSFFRLRLP